MWALAHVADCLTDGDVAGARTHLALLMVGAVLFGQRCWELAWLLTFLEDPPLSVPQPRGGCQSSFSRVCPTLPDALDDDCASVPTKASSSTAAAPDISSDQGGQKPGGPR